MSKPKVVIVGAGIAGLSAARHLSDLVGSNIDIIIFEATHRYGGRIYTVEYTTKSGKTVPIELGAMWVHNNGDPNHSLGKLIDKLELPRQECDYHGTNVQVIIPNSTNPIAPEQWAQCYSQLEDALTETSAYYKAHPTLPDKGLKSAVPRVRPDYLEKLCDPLIGRICVGRLAGHEGASWEKLSSRFYQLGLPYGGIDCILNRGYKEILDHLVNPSDGRPSLRIQYGSAVEKVDYTGNAGVKLSMSSAKESIYADAVVVTVPLGILKTEKLVFEPSLPIETRNAIQRIGYCHYSKLWILFERLAWPEDTQWFFFDAEPLGFLSGVLNFQALFGVPALICSFSGDAGIYADSLSDEDLIRKTLRYFEKAWPGIVGVKIVALKRQSWSKEPFALGSYSYPRVGMFEEDMENIRKPLGDGRVLWAGEHTCFPEGRFGFADGAYMSGIRVANHLAHLVTCGDVRSTLYKSKL